MSRAWRQWGLRGSPSVCGGFGEGTEEAPVSESSNADVCMHWRALLTARTQLPFLLFLRVSLHPVTAECLCVFIFIPPQMRIPPPSFSKALLCCRPRRERGRSLQLLLFPLRALPWPPSLLQLPSYRAGKNKQGFIISGVVFFCLHIFDWPANGSGGGKLLEGQQLHTSGFAFCWKTCQAQHREAWVQEAGGGE